MAAVETSFNFNHLSIKDLIEARDQFHVHLMNKKNVVATAIGRYLIRYSDLDENGKMIVHDKPKKKGPRTLDNSIVIDVSWPCILVLVENWEDEVELIKDSASDIIPKAVYMEDRRIVPICVVMAPKQKLTKGDTDIDTLNFPVNFYGGGSPVIIHSQGIDHVATIGCIVSDGHSFYALTNKHVVGEPGQVIESRKGDDRIPIGVSSGITLGKTAFSHLYGGWESKNIMVNGDAGLVDIEDVTRWKTDIIGINTIDELYDLNTMNMTTALIAEHKVIDNKVIEAENGRVVGYGAVSGLMKGEILGLFYRYKTVGGMEYVSDFLIAGRNGESLNVEHGDSGAVWLLEAKDDKKKDIFRPIALHWGHHRMITGRDNEQFSYSLSTCLSNVLRELDVDLIRGWNIDQDYSWGKMIHYTIGNRAISAVNKVNLPDLKKLMTANLPNISVRDTALNKTLVEKGNPDLNSNPDEGFCPLADVPDIIWKQYKLSADGTKGTSWGRKGDENPNHYADVDAPMINTGDTLFDVCPTPDKMTTAIWENYYANIDKAKIGLDPAKEVSRGLVCFRVWQIFDYMVDAVKNNDPDRYIFAAGVLAHYVGDSCQPLHSSYMSDGNPLDSEEVDYVAKRTSKKKDGTISHNKGDVYKKVVNPGSGVHVAYEDQMPDDYIDTILPGIDNILNDPQSRINSEVIDPITSGREAAFANLMLMKATQADIAPIDIVEEYKAAKGNTNVSDALFEAFGEKSIECIARGCRYLAAIWEAAWTVGEQQGGGIGAKSKRKESDLIALYRDPDELKSFLLSTIDPILKK